MAPLHGLVSTLEPFSGNVMKCLKLFSSNLNFIKINSPHNTFRYILALVNHKNDNEVVFHKKTLTCSRSNYSTFPIFHRQVLERDELIFLVISSDNLINHTTLKI
jgi:hypothetical protein